MPWRRALSVADGVDERPSGAVARATLIALSVLAGLGTATFAVTTFWFSAVEPVLDDQGLFNPIYLFAKTGHLAYPIYPAVGAEQSYFVHPPGDAVLVGSAMWLSGWTAEAAAIGCILLLVFVTVAILVASRFSLAVKFGFLAGIAAGLVVWPGASFLRPDLRLAVSFLGGLLALEAGRLANWAPGWLFLGALLVSIAATLHYPGSASVLAVVIYGAWVLLERRGWRAARTPLIALAVGSGLVMIPYVALFLFPLWSEIRAFTQAANAQYKGIFGAIRLHRQVYHYIHDAQIGGPFLAALAAPFTRFGIPVVLFTTPVLWWRRETRGIALASLPNLLFLLLFTHTKVASNSDYYIAEFTLYYACLGYLAVLGAMIVVRRLGRGRIAPTLAAAVLVGAALLGAVVHYGRAGTLYYGVRDWTPLHADMEIARAATEPTLPKNSLVLSNPSLNLWYTTGGARVYPIWRDYVYAPDISTFNVRGYLGGFTAIAGGENETWDVSAANNKQRQMIGNWYASGLLKVFRFYWGYRPRSQPEIRYLLFSTRRQPVIGHVLQHRTLVRYVEDLGGPYVLAAAYCDVKADAVRALPLYQQAPIFLPGKTNIDPYTDEQQGNPRFAMQTFLDTRINYERKILPVLRQGGCRVRRVVPMRVAWRRSVDEVLRDWRRTGDRRVIQFPRYVAADGLLFAPTVATTPVPEGVDMSALQVSVGAKVEHAGAKTKVSTPDALYAEAAQVPLRPPHGRRSWIVARGRVTRGRLTLCVIAGTNGCLTRRSVPAGTSGPFYLPIPETSDKLDFYIGNESPGVSEIDLDGLEVIKTVKR